MSVIFVILLLLVKFRNMLSYEDAQKLWKEYYISSVIGASLSEPHTCEVNEPPVCIYVYIYIYVAIRPTDPGPAAANFLIYCTLQKNI